MLFVPIHGMRRWSLVLLSLALFGALMWGRHWWTGETSAPASDPAGAAMESASTRSSLRLTVEKMAAGRLHAQSARPRKLAAVTTVPGQVRYDASRHVELRAPVECIVSEALVSPGQWVAAGDPLALLTSPEVGRLRGEIQVAAARHQLAGMQLEWQQQVADNLREFVAILDQDSPLADIEGQFADRLLGDHRDQLVSAYSRHLLALHAVRRTAELSETGLLAGQTRAQRQSDHEIAAARWRTAREQSLSLSQLDVTRAQAEYQSAGQALQVAREQLRALLGPHASTGEAAGDSQFYLHAPFAGRIEQLSAVQMLRFQPGEEMLTLADTRTVWIAAQVHSRDWPALQSRQGEALDVIVPGLAHQRLVANMLFVDAAVSPTTGAVALLAAVPNDDQALRAGMFVWVELPRAAPRDVLAVPAAAVQRRAGETFVFVQHAEDEFRRADVELGIETPEWIEIRGGIAEGDRVVDEGAFLLTSELLLNED